MHRKSSCPVILLLSLFLALPVVTGQTKPVDAAGQRLELVRGAGDSVQTTGCKLSGGIVLKREPLDMDSWLAALGATLADEAQRSRQTRQALERLLMD